MKSNEWIWKALVLGAIFFIAVWIIKPVGVSTQFSVLSGIVHSTIVPDVITKDDTKESGYQSSNAYYDKNEGKLAKNIKDPVNYDFVFVLAIPFGAYLGYLFLDKKKRKNPYFISKENIKVDKKTNWKLYLPSFIGGFLLLYGARMADGCTSGHMMSGMMQGAISGYIFAGAVFVIAIPTAIFIGMKGQWRGEK